MPEKGGATIFPKSDVFVKPKVGMATFFTYKGQNGLYDYESTEHSGCAVEEGEKWIATAWLREGVSKDDNYEKYDPTGIPLSQDAEEEIVPQLRATRKIEGENEAIILEEKEDHDEL